MSIATLMPKDCECGSSFLAAIYYTKQLNQIVLCHYEIMIAFEDEVRKATRKDGNRPE